MSQILIPSKLFVAREWQVLSSSPQWACVWRYLGPEADAGRSVAGGVEVAVQELDLGHAAAMVTIHPRVLHGSVVEVLLKQTKAGTMSTMPPVSLWKQT